MICSKESLKSVKGVRLERPPDAGRGWRGVPHGAFIDAVRAGLEDVGCRVKKTTVTTSPDRLTLGASFATDVRLVADLSICVTLLTSNDRHLSPRMVYGCVDSSDRGFAFDEVAVGRLDKEFDLPAAVAAACGGLADWKKRAAARVRVLKGTKTDVADALLFMAGLAREGGPVTVPWANVAKADELFNSSDDRTRWGLYKAFSEVTRRDPPLKQVPRLLLFGQRLSEGAA